MEKPFLPFSRPSISEQDINAVVDVLRSGWITTGAKCEQLEKQFQEITGCTHAVALTSATAGMHLALHALDIGPGDEVIMPSLNWVSTANLVTTRGAIPVFADIDRDTLMMSTSDIEPLITERTRLIVPVHYAGAAADLDPIHKLAATHQIAVVEDAAHALGTNYRHIPIGRSGTAIFSLHPIKNVTTAEGGVFCTDDESLALCIRRLKFHGLGVDAYDRLAQGRAPQAEVIEPGFKYNLPDMNAVLGIGQLRRLDEINSRRAEVAQQYLKGFSTVDEIAPLEIPDCTSLHSWHLFIVRLQLKMVNFSRNTFMDKLKSLGIGTGLHFRAVHTQKFYRELSGEKPHLPNTEWNSERICSLPLFPDISREDVSRVVDTVKSVLYHARK